MKRFLFHFFLVFLAITISCKPSFSALVNNKTISSSTIDFGKVYVPQTNKSTILTFNCSSSNSSFKIFPPCKNAQISVTTTPVADGRKTDYDVILISDTILNMVNDSGNTINNPPVISFIPSSPVTESRSVFNTPNIANTSTWSINVDGEISVNGGSLPGIYQSTFNFGICSCCPNNPADNTFGCSASTTKNCPTTLSDSRCVAANKGSLTMKIQIIKPITLKKLQDLSFGSFLLPTAATNSLTSEGITSGIVSLVRGSNAKFSVTGEPNTSYSVTVDPSINLTLNGANGGSKIVANLSINNSNSSTLSSFAFDGNGFGQDIEIKGILQNVATNQTMGKYLATFNVQANY